MKKTALLSFSLLILSLGAMAFGTGALNLKSYDHAPITVSIDRQLFTATANQITIPSLSAGPHYIEVKKTVYTTPYGPVAQYPVYSGWVTIPANAMVYAHITHTNNFRIDQLVYAAPVYDNACNNNYTYYPANAAMNSSAFQMLQHTISGLAFESSRQAVMEQALQTNYFSSVQVLNLMNMLSFESTKLDIAEEAYRRVIDPENYFVVNQGFSFSASIDALQDYISRR